MKKTLVTIILVLALTVLFGSSASAYIERTTGSTTGSPMTRSIYKDAVVNQSDLRAVYAKRSFNGEVQHGLSITVGITQPLAYAGPNAYITVDGQKFAVHPSDVLELDYKTFNGWFYSKMSFVVTDDLRDALYGASEVSFRIPMYGPQHGESVTWGWEVPKSVLQEWKQVIEE